MNDAVGVRCANCDWTDYRSQVRPVKDLLERLDGPVVLLPIGECPRCGALVYAPEDERTYELLTTKADLCDAIVDRMGGLIDVLSKLGPFAMKDPNKVAAAVAALRPLDPEWQLSLGEALVFVRTKMSSTSDPRVVQNVCRRLAEEVESRE